MCLEDLGKLWKCSLWFPKGIPCRDVKELRYGPAWSHLGTYRTEKAGDCQGPLDVRDVAHRCLVESCLPVVEPLLAITSSFFRTTENHITMPFRRTTLKQRRLLRGTPGRLRRPVVPWQCGLPKRGWSILPSVTAQRGVGFLFVTLLQCPDYPVQDSCLRDSGRWSDDREQRSFC